VLTAEALATLGESADQSPSFGDLRLRDWLFQLARFIAVPTLSVVSIPARADFFDDVRHTFQTDIPHFFQDDIPCAFGGKPTSGTKTSCKSPNDSKKHPTHKEDHPPDQAKPSEGQTTPPNSGQ
jgi:hypothetical protein